MFETTGILNDEVLKSLKKHVIKPTFKIILEILAVLLIFMGVVYVFLYLLDIYKSILFVIFCFCAATYFIWLPIYFANKFYKVNISRLGEINEAKQFEYKVYFDEVGAIVNNLTTRSTVNIRYDFFIRVVEVTDLYFIFTKSDQFIIIFKDCLDNKQINDFNIFIKEKCKNIK